MIHLTLIYIVNVYLLARMAFMSVCMDVHISICAYMCEVNIKDICSCVHVYMQIEKK